MKYLLGSKKEFLDFLSNIRKKDKITILAHNDLDGLAATLFLEKILATRKIKANFIEFLGHHKEVLEEMTKKLIKNKISKVFFLDFSVDLGYLKDFEKFRKKFDTFLIDHHPINPNLKNKKGMIKTESNDCTALTLYDLAKDFFNVASLDWLACVAIVAEWSYKNPENMKFLQERYPGITDKNYENSEPGKTYMRIEAGLRYYKKDLKKVYGFIKDKNLESLKKIQKIIDSEIEKGMKEYKEKAEFYPEKNLYFAYFTPKFDLSSPLLTILSKKEPFTTFVLVSDREKDLRLNLRNQESGKDMNVLVQKAIKGLKDGVSGGHFNAAGGSIQKEDVEKFKENLLKD